MDVNMLGACVILMVLGEHNSRLVVGEEGGGLIERDKNFSNKRVQPQCLFHGMHRSNIPALGY